MLKAATGPRVKVIGLAIALASGMLVSHVRLNPDGAQIARVTNGLRPLAMACGHHTRHHIVKPGSGPAPI